MLYTQNLTCCCYIFLYIASSHTNFYTLSLHDALPISLGTRSSSFILIHMIMPVLCIRIWMVLLNFIKNDFVRFSNIMGTFFTIHHSRSEERRVGKECRFQLARYASRKKLKKKTYCRGLSIRCG